VASAQDFNADKYARFYNSQTIASDFRQMRKPAGYFSNRNYVANINTFKLLTANIQPNSDYVPLVDTGAEKAFFLRHKVDLFNPLSNSIVAYQELTEPDSYPQIMRERFAYYSNYRPDQRLLGQLSAQLANVGQRSNWRQLEGMLYQLMPAPVLRDLWNKLEVVSQFREHVNAGTPPKKPRLFFQFMDNVAQNRFAQNGAIIRDILQNLGGQKLGPVIIRALAVNAAMLKDRALFDAVVTRLVPGNADISDIEKSYLSALATQWFRDEFKSQN